ncbi:MmcQ/YjbR family DNA-binding protein [Mucilaginibacter sp. SP1R1]|uniref:MmcQ/YjbR family DNA-binding protein n=1 Tax=Mucilaginibacter sp. SP1R1 TaxID=2723091 RepID=UPI00160EC848|nr:MmcQ/YjbR family DNA-binding protein [Mucilaginibacter sp. SP1R1]MBB6148887.1 putative DNA-binding protein (MmcQ/YjbR family) [Mucilaginibacter sp. SP1R1]
MNVEEFRDFCLSFPDTREGMPFEGFFKNAQAILVFYVGKKMFCLFDLNKFDRCTLKCDPNLIDELREHEGINKPFNLSPKHWISVDLNGGRHKLIEDLKAQYPGYLSQIDSDKIKNSELLPILEKINQAFVLRIAYQARAEKLDKAIKEEADAINETYDQKQKLIMRIGEIQQLVAEDGIKFTIQGNTEEEKAIYIRKNLLSAIRDQAKGNTDLNNVLASNKYDNLISGLNVYGNALVSTTQKQKDSHDQVKKLTDDLTKFKASSGYNDTIPGADLLDALSVKVKTLNAVLDNTKKGSAEYIKMIDLLKKANQELKDGPNDPSVLKAVPATMDQIDALTGPQSGKSAETLAKEQRARELAAKKLEEYNKQLQEMRNSMNQLAEGARKGTVDDLDAQLQVIQDKYQKIIANINKLMKDPHTTAAIRKELTSRLNAIPGEEKLAKNTATNDFNKKADERDQKENDDELKGASGRIDSIYGEGQSELDKQQNKALTGIKGDNPALVEAQRLNIKEIYAQKAFELEQKHLQDMKALYAVYGKDTGKLDKTIADNAIKENNRAAQQKTIQDKAYISAKKEISQMEMSTLQAGAQFLESILDKRSALYVAALIVDKAVAVAQVVISTEAAIVKFTESVAALGPIGLPLVAAYSTMAHVQEGIAIASIAAQTITQLSSGSSKKAAKGGIFDGASHDNGGLNVVDPKTGRTVVNVEGGEPFMVLSKETRRNNGALINQLLFNSMFRNGAAVDVAGVDKGIQVAKNGGVFSNAAIQALTGSVSGTGSVNGNQVINNSIDMSESNRLLAELTQRFDDFSKKPWDFNNRTFEQYQKKVADSRNAANA